MTGSERSQQRVPSAGAGDDPVSPEATPYETLRYDPAGGDPSGFARLERHMARLARSAAYTGVPLDVDVVTTALATAVRAATSALRVRLSLDGDGRPVVVTEALLPPYEGGFADEPSTALRLAGAGPWSSVVVAEERVDQDDPARRHKTSDRALYELGRAYAPAHGLADVLFLNLAGELAEGAISTVYVERGGSFLTPPVESGALPGVLREELLDLGLVREERLSERDLRDAEIVMISSSVRGLRRVVVEGVRVRLSGA